MMALISSAALVISPQCDAAAAASTIECEDLSLARVTIGMTEDDVVRLLGKPQSVIETGDHLNVQWDYGGLTVWLDEGSRVGEILSTVDRYCTPAGICPGATFESLIARCGPPMVSIREDGRYLEYFGSKATCWLQISMSEDVAKSLRVECQP